MARAVQKKAAKDYPDSGIKKGDLYWYVKIKLQRGGIVKRSLKPFRRSQLTMSDYLGQLYDWEDAKNEIESMDSAQELADTIRELGEEQQGKYDNMPESLQQGDTGQMIEQRAQACETAAEEIEAVIGDWETAKEEHDQKVSSFEEYENSRIMYEEDPDNNEEPEEVDDPGEFDEEEFLDRVKEVEVSE